MKTRSVLAAGAVVLLAASGLALSAPAIASASQQATAQTEAKVTIPVEGLSCASCSLVVRRALKKVDGVKRVEAGAEANEAVVTYDPSKVKPEQLVETINGLGYKAGSPIKGS